jgi:hypothetical protein
MGIGHVIMDFDLKILPRICSDKCAGNQQKKPAIASRSFSRLIKASSVKRRTSCWDKGEIGDP